MPALYLDTDLNRRLGVALRALGHDALIAIDDPARHDLPDAVHLLDAAEVGRILLTQSKKDYLVLHQALARWTRRWRHAVRSAGIIIIDAFPTTTPEAVARALDAALRSDWVPGEAVWQYNHRHGWKRGYEGSHIRFARDWAASPLDLPPDPNAWSA